MREEERRKTSKRRAGPKHSTLPEKIQQLKRLGLSNCEIYEVLTTELQLDYLCSENARKAKKLLHLDSYHTAIEFGYWVE